MSPSEAVVLDAHAHYHPCYRAGPFLDGALDNLRRGARALGVGGRAPLCLALCALDDGDPFAALEVGEAHGPGRRWWLEGTEEPCSRVARRRDGATVWLLGGRQVATAEGLEVLALCTVERFEGGRPLATLARQILEAGAVAVVPWGAGKWSGRRATVVAELVRARPAGRPLLADNGARPRWGRQPRPFDLARAVAVPVLMGSDPLPFPSHERRAGRCGLALEGPLDPRRPAASIRRSLQRLRGQPRTYGDPDSLPRFLRDQAAMLIRKRLAPAGRPA